MLDKRSILVADDEYPTRKGVMSTIQEWSNNQIEVFTAENGIKALELARACRPDVVISDIRMPGMNGIELLEQMRVEGMETTVILLSGYAEFEYAQKAVKLGAANYVLKPIEHEELIAVIQDALNRSAGRNKFKPAEGRGGTQELTIVQERTNALPDALVTRNVLIQKAIVYIQSEFTCPTLGIKDVARHVHLNASYMSVLFKEEMKITFSDFLIGLRLRRAKELLLSTDLMVYEIAEKAGFSTSKYFVKVFRESEGMTPVQYRRFCIVHM